MLVRIEPVMAPRYFDLGPSARGTSSWSTGFILFGSQYPIYTATEPRATIRSVQIGRKYAMRLKRDFYQSEETIDRKSAEVSGPTD